MSNRGFIARIPGAISEFVLYVTETRKWSIATALTEIAKTSSLYHEYSTHKENRVS
jgi:hypothetical protein